MSATYDLAVVGLGGLGSAAVWQAARRGLSVVGIEQFELGHDRGASHDTSRIIRHSYHTPQYVALTFAAYDDWADLESASGEALVTITGGVDIFPAGGLVPIEDYTRSLDAHAVPYELLTAATAMERYPAMRLADDVTVLHQERTGIVPAGRTVSTLQGLARTAGATLLDRTPVRALIPRDDAVDILTDDGVVSAGRVVVTADAWAGPLLAPLGVDLRLTVLEEQVTYFTPADPRCFDAGRFPVWIWMDDPSYYGFPTYGEDTVKAAQDCGGPEVTGDDRSGDEDPVMLGRLSDFMARTFPGSGPSVRSKRCLYSLTPDRDFVISAVPDHPQVTVGLASAHGFKFVPTFGRLLTELAVDGRTDADIAGFELDRPALTDPAYTPHWLV